MYSSRLQAESYRRCHWPDLLHNFLEFSDINKFFGCFSTNVHNQYCKVIVILEIKQRRINCCAYEFITCLKLMPIGIHVLDKNWNVL